MSPLSAVSPRFSAALSRRQLLSSAALAVGGLTLNPSGKIHAQEPAKGSLSESPDAFTLRGKPVMVLKRDGHIGVQALASAVVTDADGHVIKQFTAQDSTLPINVHSAVKPLHTGFLVDVMRRLQGQKSSPALPQLQPEELAVMSASHAGTGEHRKWVSSALGKFGLDERYMVCGGRYPYDEGEKTALIKKDVAPKDTPKLFDMCSGHHASQGIMAKVRGEAIDSYAQADSPVQQSYTTALADLSGDPKTQLVKWDNCNIPTFNLSLGGFARAFARFVTEPRYQPVVAAMAQHPVLIDDEVSLDTRLIQITRGNLIAKLGSEGLIVVGNREKKQSLVLKEWCGNSHGNYRERITIQALTELGWLSKAQADQLFSEAEFHREDTKHGVTYQFNPVLWEKP